jgi:hypothetical protein
VRTSFQLDQTIAVVADGAYFDLHNCFDFVGFEYRATEKKARLEWKRDTGDWVAKGLPKKLILSFDGVTNFAAKKRDDEMPFTEDSCLASITFLPPELSGHFDAVYPGKRFKDEHLSIEFQSGSGFKIWAESATHEIEPA